MDVPERGNPETTMMGAVFEVAAGVGFDFFLNIDMPI